MADDTKEEKTSRKMPDRNDELSGRKDIRDQVFKLHAKVNKAFENQNSRTNDALDNWEAFRLKLGDRQFYNGNSRVYIPFVRDAVDARQTRFSNQLFPVSGRFVEVTTPDDEIPHARMALLEHYVRRDDLKTRVVRPLIAVGDCEGQYSLYVSWESKTRYAGARTTNDDQEDDYEEIEVTEAGPHVEIINDPDLVISPVTCDGVEDAIAKGGFVAIIRRWTKATIKKMIADKEFTSKEGEAVVEEMTAVQTPNRRKSPQKEIASILGIKEKGGHLQGVEIWTHLKIAGTYRLCRIYMAGPDRILGVKLCPYWSDKCPVLSVPVERDAGVAKGRPPVSNVLDLQVLANDTLNEGADTGHYSAMPIIMTDPEKNPKANTMVLGLGAIWQTSPKDTQFAEFPPLWKDCFERLAEVKQQIFQTLGVNPSMIPAAAGRGKKMNQAELANEQQVDILTTADAVTVIEEGILTPMLERFMEYDYQFREDEITVRMLGEVGQKAIMQDVEPQQDNARYFFKWYGVEAARNAAMMQQQTAAINVLKEIPPQLYQDYTLNLAPLLKQMAENLFGPRLAPLILVDKNEPSVDPMIENDMLEHGFDVAVHPGDDDQQHMQAHMQLMQSGDPHGNVRKHLQMHQQQMQHKAQAAQMAQGGGPGGGGNPNGGGAPSPGAQPGAPANMKQMPGAVHPDQMAAHGALPPPRR